MGGVNWLFECRFCVYTLRLTTALLSGVLFGCGLRFRESGT